MSMFRFFSVTCLVTGEVVFVCARDIEGAERNYNTPNSMASRVPSNSYVIEESM